MVAAGGKENQLPDIQSMYASRMCSLTVNNGRGAQHGNRNAVLPQVLETSA